MSPGSAEVLEGKAINKQPLLCKLGFHKWRTVRIHNYKYIKSQAVHDQGCTRCPAQRTAVVAL